MCIACGHTLDQTKLDAFADRYLALLNGGMVALMVSLGHRTGLFDKMADAAWRTSDDLARHAGLNERYVREWLGAMLAGRIVERDVESNAYRLPAEHAHWLSRQSPTANLAVFAQYLPVLAGVEDRIVECFRNGGGVAYEEYPRFHEVMAEDSGQSIVPIILDQVVPLIPGLHERLQTGIDVLDVGCGRGRALIQLAKAYPNSYFTGYDLSEEALAYARTLAEAEGLPNIRFDRKDLTDWIEPGAFDWILALDAIHDQARPDKVLRAIRIALRTEGVFFMQDIDASSEPADNMDHPLGALLYTVSTMHCMTVSLAQGGLGLGAVWGVQTAERMLREAGFSDVHIHRFEHDVQNAYFIVHP